MSPFKTLGLDRKADIAQIKRACARLLRTHRPDEVRAFQRLHEAYETCLTDRGIAKELLQPFSWLRAGRACPAPAGNRCLTHKTQSR